MQLNLKIPGNEFLRQTDTQTIFTDVIAAPCNEDSKMRLKALPIVMPKPRSNGSQANFPKNDEAVLASSSSAKLKIRITSNAKTSMEDSNSRLRISAARSFQWM